MSLIKDFIGILNREMPLSYLQKRGLKVGKNFSKQQGCFFDPSHCFLIEIGDNVTFSNRVTLLAHDASSKRLTSYVKIGRIKIHDNVFVGAGSTILPNTIIGENAVIGAGSVVTKDVPTGCVVAGNPASVIMTVEEYEQKLKRKLNQTKPFGEEYTIRKKVNQAKKEELQKAVEKNGICFIK